MGNCLEWLARLYRLLASVTPCFMIVSHGAKITTGGENRVYGWVARSGDRPQVGERLLWGMKIGSTVGWLGRETGHRLGKDCYGG